MSIAIINSTPVEVLVNSGTLINYGPGTVYYRDEQPVTATTNDGSLTTGQSAALDGAQWLATAGDRASVDVLPLPAGSVTLSDNAQITLTAKNPAGTISRLVQFKMPSIFERPWISWLDEAARHRVALGFHRWDVSDAAFHDRIEIKTSADPGGASPSEMRTRFAVGTDGDRVAIIFNFTTGIEVNAGDFASATAFGITFKSPDSGGTSRTVGNIQTQIDGSGNTIMELDPRPPSTSLGATLKIFRQVNTSSSARKIEIKKGDGTNTSQFIIDAARGAIDFIELGADPTSPAAGTRSLYAKATGIFMKDSAGTVTQL